MSEEGASNEVEETEVIEVPVSQEGAADLSSGPIAWMAKNSVAANLLMFALVIGGLAIGNGIKQEVFPEFDMDWITIMVPYPGASPSEVEQGIVLAVEEAVRPIDGVKQVVSSSRESGGSIYVELLAGADSQEVISDIKNAVDRIAFFPEDAERPVIGMMSNRREVISLALHGEHSADELKKQAEYLRDALLQHEDITQVDVTGLPPREIAIEISRNTLRAHGLTLDQVAQQVRSSSRELPGGSMKTSGGEVLLRTDERRDAGSELAGIPMIQTGTGVAVTLGELATIRDDFADSDESATFQGEPAILVKAYRVGDETPVTVADGAREVMAVFQDKLPKGMSLGVLKDRSEMYRQRIDLLMRNAYMGLFLVLMILGLFLEIRLAFWVTLGIPISFCGALLFMPFMGVSINMISLFAFIVTLGMVVDDAIIVGENIYYFRQKGLPLLDAAVRGAREVAQPVCFSILTTMAAFSPMFFVPGFSGKLFGVIPAIVITVLGMSLVESLWVLPAHLAHQSERPKGGVLALLYTVCGMLAMVFRPVIWVFDRSRIFCSGGLERFIKGPYSRLLHRLLRYRYLTVASGLVFLLLTFGWIGGGWIAFTFMPKIESDRVIAKATLPIGVPVERTKDLERRMVDAARATFSELGGEGSSRGIYTQLGKGIPTGGPVGMVRDQPGGHLANVQVRLVSSGDRDFTAQAFAERWRGKVGEIPGVETLTFSSSMMHGGGATIHIRLSHDEVRVLESAAEELAEELGTYAGVTDIDAGFSPTKPRLDLKLTPEARSLDVTAQSLGRQVRSAFFGSEALRLQRGRDEVKVYVRLPEEERRSIHDLESMMVRTPRGGEIPLGVAAKVTEGRADTFITRHNGKKVIDVTADIEASLASADEVMAKVISEKLPVLMGRYPGLGWSLDGQKAEQQQTMKSLVFGFLLSMLVVYGLLAIPFKSYVQPLVVMSAIPFGMVGAVIGHIFMGFNISVISMMGIVAVSGVVVNDSLVLIDAANRYRAEGRSTFDSIHAASLRRFRPILLTSLTTFGGLLPMIFETSLQARFLIPMAISLGYGVLFATFIILGLVPAFYLIVEDGLYLAGTNDEAPPMAGVEPTVEYAA
jgi:multidrug efflux pump subunit AcrB